MRAWAPLVLMVWGGVCRRDQLSCRSQQVNLNSPFILWAHQAPSGSHSCISPGFKTLFEGKFIPLLLSAKARVEKKGGRTHRKGSCVPKMIQGAGVQPTHPPARPHRGSQSFSSYVQSRCVWTAGAHRKTSEGGLIK